MNEASTRTTRTLSLLALLLTLSINPFDLAAQGLGAPRHRFGLLVGANYNMVGVDTAGFEQFSPANGTLLGPDEADGIAPYVGLAYNYVPGTIGFHLRGTYDDRSADAVATESWATRLRYISLEPALRISPGTSGFHINLGGSLNLLISDAITATSTTATATTGVDTAMQSAFGLWGGIGYDIEVAHNDRTGAATYLTPFLSAHWLPEQVRNVAGSWSTTTIRGGLALTFGFGKKVDEEEEEPLATDALDLDIRTPGDGIADARPMEEFLPLLNYLFFPKGTTTIPPTYQRLDPAQAEAFDEEEIGTTGADPMTGPTGGSTRSARQMQVYYNMMNVIGERMTENPSARITVVGAAARAEDGKAMAEEVKSYIVGTFGVEASRVATKGQTRPPHASGSRSTPVEDKDLVAEENIRVEILSDDPNVLKPVRLTTLDEAPLENDVVFQLRLKSAEAIAEWDLAVTGENSGFAQSYGPFYGGTARVNATPMLASNDASYTAAVTALTHDGERLTYAEDFTLQRSTRTLHGGTRYSILFEYDDSKSITTYDRFLRDEVAPRIPDGATVFIHGHTDLIGRDEYNQELSARRAVDAQKILADELKKRGTSATFDTYGFGEATARAPFDNDSPEERYYNRTVMIEIVPAD